MKIKPSALPRENPLSGTQKQPCNSKLGKEYKTLKDGS
jgi:hypothetical protein